MSNLTSRIGARRACRYAAAGRGFTLVELLVVIAIIALLVSILLPSLSKAKEQARIAVCLTNLKALSTAFSGYTAENNQWYPAGAGYGFTDEYTWDSILQPYYKNFDLLHCPSDNLDRSVWWYIPKGANTERKVFPCYPVSYAINACVSCTGPSCYGRDRPRNPYDGNVPPFPWPGNVHKTSCVLNPAETILLGEMWELVLHGYGQPGMYHICRSCGIIVHPIDEYRYKFYRAPTAYVHRNNDAANYLFCDGHATLLPGDHPNLNPAPDPRNDYFPGNDYYYYDYWMCYKRR